MDIIQSNKIKIKTYTKKVCNGSIDFVFRPMDDLYDGEVFGDIETHTESFENGRYENTNYKIFEYIKFMKVFQDLIKLTSE
jgi:hypothetical protein